MTADQLALALSDRHDGQQANLAAATRVHRDDRARVEHAVAELVRLGQSFTADNVHAVIKVTSGDAPYDRNLVSSVMGVWAQHRWIVEDSQRPTPSAARSRRASRNRWWIGAPANIPEARHG